MSGERHKCDPELNKARAAHLLDALELCLTRSEISVCDSNMVKTYLRRSLNEWYREQTGEDA